MPLDAEKKGNQFIIRIEIYFILYCNFESDELEGGYEEKLK